MKRIAKFHKVSKERFTADWIDTFAQSQEEAEKVYEAIRLPKRATAGSAGYDFFAPAEFTLKPGETVKIPTGIRVEMQPEWVLKCYPRSGLGFKYRLQLTATAAPTAAPSVKQPSVIISIQITKATFFQRSQMIPMKTKLLQSRQIQDSCRESL